MPQANYIIFAGDIKMDGSRFLSPLSMKCSEEWLVKLEFIWQLARMDGAIRAPSMGNESFGAGIADAVQTSRVGEYRIVPGLMVFHLLQLIP